jgi:hypothetical protein
LVQDSHGHPFLGGWKENALLERLVLTPVIMTCQRYYGV